MRVLFHNMRITIAAQEPTARSINVDGRMYFLNWPHIVFALKWKKVYGKRLYAYASDKPVTSLTDSVRLLPLPNVYSDGRVCNSSKSYDNIQAAVVDFWSSTFREAEMGFRYWDSFFADNWRLGPVNWIGDWTLKAYLWPYQDSYESDVFAPTIDLKPKAFQHYHVI